MGERSGGLMAGGESYEPVLRNPGDWVALAALVPFVLSAFVLEWISVRVIIPDYVPFVGGMESQRLRTTIGLFDIPWYWIVLVFMVLAACIACFFLVRTRGGVTLGAGIFYLLFAVLFFFGAWYKINAIIGDIVGLFAKIPLVGPLVEEAITRLTKDALVVTFQPGFYVFIAAGLLLVAGGVLRLLTGTKTIEAPVSRGHERGT